MIPHLLRPVAASLLLASIAHAQYRYTKIVEFHADPFVFIQHPPVNNHGTVAFMTPVKGAGVEGLHLGSGGPQRTVIAEGFLDFRTSSLNDHDQTAVAAEDHNVYRVDRQGHATLIAEPDPDPDFEFYDPAINNHGTVAVTASLDKDGNTAVFAGDGRGEAVPISDSEEGPLNFHSAPSINNHDDIAFSAYDTTTLTFGVYLYHHDHIHRLYANGSDPIVNDHRVVAFTRFGTAPGATSVVRGNGGALTVIADSTGQFSHVFATAINDRGDVAFLGSLAAGGVGVFVGDGHHTTKVAASGDAILGKTVAQVSPASLNDEGELAFHVKFTDDTSAIVRAAPQHHHH